MACASQQRSHRTTSEHTTCIGTARKHQLTLSYVFCSSQLSDSDSDDDAGSSSSSSTSSAAPAVHSFPALTDLITSTLALYPIFPKINNLAPQDAQWILPLSAPLKCTAVEDVYLALKASALTAVALDNDRDLSSVDEDDGSVVEGVIEDMRPEEGAEGNEREGERVEIVLKKWYDLDRSREFRLFIRDETLIGQSGLCLWSLDHQLGWTDTIPCDLSIL